MNSDVELVTGAPDAARRLERACRWLTAFEARFSRFRSDSELSRLNAHAGEPFRASPLLFELVRVALELARRSDGRFDPTVLGSMVAAGYDRSFELIGSGVRVRTRGGFTPQVSWRDVELAAGRRVVRLPAGVGLDLGGIGKGWAVDRLARMLGRPSLVNGGGDVFASGRPPDGPAWLVGVENPLRPDEDLLMLRAVDHGIATSSSLRRRWRSGDAVLHHLIDPRTGRPSGSDAVQVTVIAPSTLIAEYHAKVALLLGAAAGLDYLDRLPDIEGIVVRADGALLMSRCLSKYL